ncbi:MAG: hypothetical protein K0B37_15070 [Bacteroidales bacterium]|nr:hypothetical protein [Bacteroidales bacterium]
MVRKLEKIQKIANGILQHFTAMDKGFARVESDLMQVKMFRNICYDADENLNKALLTFVKSLSTIQKRDPLVSAVTDKDRRQKISDSLMQLRQVAGNSLEMIMDYIDQYPDSGKKSYSLEALHKFSSVLEQEFRVLEQEINALKMHFILEDRKEQLMETIRVAEEENQQR